MHDAKRIAYSAIRAKPRPQKMTPDCNHLDEDLRRDLAIVSLALDLVALMRMRAAPPYITSL